MEFMDYFCDGTGALGLHDNDDDDDEDVMMLDGEEEIDFEGEDGSLFTLSQGESETHTGTGTYTYTHDGSSTVTSLYTGPGLGRSNKATEGPLAASQQSGLQKTTPLFDAIDQQLWRSVNAFLTSGKWDTRSSEDLPNVPLKEEARQWSVTLDKSGKVMSRRLPIHAAIMTKAPVDIVRQLLDLYPNGGSCADSQGNLPLHLAFQCDAENAVIQLLLDRYPEAVLVKNNSKRGKFVSKGLLPMECGNKNKKDVMIKVCQERARALSYENVKSGFVAASTGKLLSRTMSNTRVVPLMTMANDNDNDNDKQQEEDLEKIQRELDELRRDRSDASNRWQNTSAEPTLVDNWMRSTFQGTFLESALVSKSMPGEEHHPLPVIAESMSDTEDSGVKTNNNNKAPPSSSTSVWRRLAANKNNGDVNEDDTDDGDDTKGGESFEVNLTSRSVTTAHSSSSKFKRRLLPLLNPFSCKDHRKTAPEEQQVDTVTIQSGTNVSSRFSLSGIKSDDDADREAAATSDRSLAAKSTPSGKFNRRGSMMSSGSRSIKSSSSRKFFSKSSPTWFHRRKNSRDASNNGSSNTSSKELSPSDKSLPTNTNQSKSAVKESPSRSSTHTPSSTVVFADEEAQQQQGGGTSSSKTETGSGSGGVFSSWNIEQSGLAQAMSSMILVNAAASATTTTDTPEGEEEKEQEQKETSDKVVSKDGGNTDSVTKKSFRSSFLRRNQQKHSSDKVVSEDDDFEKTDSVTKKSFGSSFLRKNQQSFLENSFLACAASKQSRKLNPDKEEKDEVTNDDGAEAEEEEDLDEEVDDDGSLSSDSGSSDDLSHTSSEDMMEHSSSMTESSDLDEAAVEEIGSSGAAVAAEKSKRAFSWTNARKDSGEKKKHKRRRRAEKKMLKKLKKSDSSKKLKRKDSCASSGDEKRKAKFALFRRRKSSENVDATNTSVASKNADTLSASGARPPEAEEPRVSFLPVAPKKTYILPSQQAMDPTIRPGHSRHNSISSSQGSVARSVLPPKGDWRSEYQEYLSSQSVGTADKKSKAEFLSSLDDEKRVEPVKKGVSLRDVMKGSRRRDSKKNSLEKLRLFTSPCTEEILSDLESVSQFVLDDPTDDHSFHRRRSSISSSKPTREAALLKDSSTQSTGPVVSESTLENSDEGNVYLVRVQF